MPRIDEKYAIRLMRIHHEISERLSTLSAFGVEVFGLECHEGILDTLIDSYGFPSDNSSPKRQTGDESQPVFCRDLITSVYFNTVVEGTDDEFRRVLEQWSEMSKDMTQFYWTENFHH